MSYITKVNDTTFVYPSRWAYLRTCVRAWWKYGPAKMGWQRDLWIKLRRK